MIDPVLTDALNEQLNLERYNQALYLAFSAELELINWKGSAKFFNRAADEEGEHADKIKSWLIDRSARPVYESLDAPEYTAPLELRGWFDLALMQERKTADAIRALYAQADIETQVFLQWFLLEQVESEREYTDIITELSRATCPAALLILDREYGEL